MWRTRTPHAPDVPAHFAVPAKQNMPETHKAMHRSNRVTVPGRFPPYSGSPLSLHAPLCDLIKSYADNGNITPNPAIIWSLRTTLGTEGSSSPCLTVIREQVIRQDLTPMCQFVGT